MLAERVGSVLRFVIILGGIAGAASIVFAMYRAAHPTLITDLQPKDHTLRVYTTQPARLRLYAADVPVAEMTTPPGPAPAVFDLPRPPNALAVRAITEDGRRTDIKSFGSYTLPGVSGEPTGSRFVTFVLGKRRITAAATITLPRTDERVQALLKLAWPARAFTESTLDEALQPSPGSHTYYTVPSFVGDTAAWETTYRGGDVTVHAGSLVGAVPAPFPATDKIAFVLHVPWSRSRPFQSDVLQVRFDDFVPSRFDPMPEAMTSDRRLIWRSDQHHPIDRVTVTLEPSRRSTLATLRDWLTPDATSRWAQAAYSIVYGAWAAVGILLVARLGRKSFPSSHPPVAVVAWSLAALTFAPAVSELVNDLPRIMPRSQLSLAFYSVSELLIVAFGAVFIVAALVLVVVPRGWLAFVATLALVVAIAAAAESVDARFYVSDILGDTARSRLFWRDVGSALTLCSTALLLWWTLRPFPQLRRIKRIGIAAVFLETALLITLSWPFGWESFLPPLEPVPGYGGVAQALNQILFSLASAAPLLFGLLFLTTGRIGRTPADCVRTRRIFAAACVALFVVGPHAAVAYLPLPAAIAFGLMFVALVNDDRWNAIDRLRRVVVRDRRYFVDRALDLREAERVDNTLESLGDQFTAGTLSPDDYDKRVAALRAHAAKLRAPIPADDAPVVERLAFGGGVAADDLGNGRRAAFIGFCVALGFAAVLAQQALALDTRTPALGFTVAVTLLTFVGGRTLIAFVFGYVFAHLQGSSGVTKAAVLACVQIAATLPVWILSGPTSTILANALAIVAFDVIVGFLAFDLPNLRLIRPTLLTPRRLIAGAGLQNATVILALFSGSIVSLLTGQMSVLAAAAIKAAFPNAPVLPFHGQ